MTNEEDISSLEEIHNDFFAGLSSGKYKIDNPYHISIVEFGVNTFIIVPPEYYKWAGDVLGNAISLQSLSVRYLIDGIIVALVDSYTVSLRKLKYSRSTTLDMVEKLGKKTDIDGALDWLKSLVFKDYVNVIISNPAFSRNHIGSTSKNTILLTLETLRILTAISRGIPQKPIRAYQMSKELETYFPNSYIHAKNVSPSTYYPSDVFNAKYPYIPPVQRYNKKCENEGYVRVVSNMVVPSSSSSSSTTTTATKTKTGTRLRESVDNLEEIYRRELNAIHDERLVHTKKQQELEDDVIKLKRELQDAKEHCADILSRKESECKTTLDTLNREIELCRNEKQRAIGSANQVELLLKQCDDYRTAGAGKTNELIEQLAEKNKQISMLEESLKEQKRQDNEKYRKMHNEFNNDIINLNSEIRDLKDEALLHESDITQIKDRTSAEIQDLKSKLDSAIREQDIDKGRIKMLESQITDMRNNELMIGSGPLLATTNAEQLEEERERLEKLRESLDNERSEWLDRVKIQEESIDKLKREANEMNTTAMEKLRLASDAERKVQNDTAESTKLRELYRSKGANLDKKEKSLKELESELNIREDTISRAIADIEKAKDINDRARLENENVARILTDLNNKIAEKEQRLSEQEDANRTRANELDIQESTLREERYALQEERERIASLKKQAELQVAQKIADSERMYEKAEDIVRSTENANREFEKNLVSATKGISNLIDQDDTSKQVVDNFKKMLEANNGVIRRQRELIMKMRSE